MEITFDFDQGERCTTVSALAGLYDTPNLKPVCIYCVPFVQNPDRLHVAAALLFHKEISGVLELSEEVPCSRHVAIQIARFFDPVDVNVKNQTLTPAAIPVGSYKAAVGFSVDNTEIPDPYDASAGESRLRFVPEAVGALFSEYEVAIGTNLLQGTASLDASIDDYLRILGAAVLFSQDYQVSGFRCPTGWKDPASIAKLENAAELLSTVRLSLNWD